MSIRKILALVVVSFALVASCANAAFALWKPVDCGAWNTGSDAQCACGDGCKDCTTWGCDCVVCSGCVPCYQTADSDFPSDQCED